MIWFAVLAGSLGCYAEKVVGYFLPDKDAELAALRRTASAKK